MFSSVPDSGQATSPTMPPKKKKTIKLCQFNNRGYCNKKEECENKHSDEVCDDLNCDEVDCDKRHPNPCKFGPRCQFKKRNECMYLHVTLASDDGKIEALSQKFSSQIEKLKNSLLKMQKDLEEKDSGIKHLQKQYETLEKEINENQLGNLKQDMEDKIAQVNSLDMRVEELEKENRAQKKQHEKKIKELENLLKNKCKKETKAEVFKCSDCEFEAKTKGGLKTHIARVHTKTKNLEYPCQCEVCDSTLKNEKEAVEHLRTHAYRKSTYKCESCDFWCENFLTMEVHIGRLHSEKRECGLCNFVANNIDNLNLHITTCEIYTCEPCSFRTTKLHDIKEHLNKEHTAIGTQWDEIIHAKVNRKDSDIIDQVTHMKSNLCQ